jgi:hypothetical protein
MSNKITLDDHQEWNDLLRKPVSRDRLSRLGDKLDAADKDGGEWVGLYDDYEALVTARALKARPPKIKTIKSIADYWTTDALLVSIGGRRNELAAELAKPDQYGLRAIVDMRAAYAVARRDHAVVYEAIKKYKDGKEAGKQRAKAIAKARRQRVSGIAKAIHSAIGRAAR